MRKNESETGIKKSDGTNKNAGQGILIREVTRLILNPKIQDIRLRTYAAFVMDALTHEQVGTINPERVCYDIEQKFKLKDVHASLVTGALEHLQKENFVTKDENVFILDEGQKKRIQNECSAGLNRYEAAFLDFEKSLEMSFGKLDEYQHKAVRKAFDSVIVEILIRFGDSAIVFFTEQKQTVSVDDVEDLLWKNSELFVKMGLERAPQLGEAFSKVFHECLKTPPQNFALGILHITKSYIMMKVLNVDPALQKVEKLFFSGVKIFLDTNVLIALLCTGSERHIQTKELIKASRNLGIQFFVSDFTAEEFDKSVRTVIHKHSLMTNKMITTDILDNEIIRTYYRDQKKYGDWTIFTAYLHTWKDILSKEFGVKILMMDRGGFVATDIDDIKRGLFEANVTKYTQKHYDVVEHDAKNILLIHQMRLKERLPMRSPWFLTHDTYLQRADAYLSKKWRSDAPTTIGCDVWFSIINPFLGYMLPESEVASLLSKMIYLNQTSYDAVSIKDFLSYIGSEMKIAEQDIDIALRIISESHLARTLNEDLGNGATLNAVEKIREVMVAAIGEKRTSDELRGRLHAVASKLSEMKREKIIDEHTAKPVHTFETLCSDISSRLRKGIRNIPEKEKEIQDAVELLLSYRDYEFYRENYAIPVSTSSRKPDFVLETLTAALEVKLIVKPEHEKTIVDEIAADMTTYSTRFKRLLFVVYDAGGVIRDEERFKNGLEKEGIVILIVKH